MFGRRVFVEQVGQVFRQFVFGDIVRDDEVGGATLAVRTRIKRLPGAGRAGDRLAQLDDRDVAQLLQAMELDGKPVVDEGLLAWLGGGPGRLALRWQGRDIDVERLGTDEAPRRFGFVRRPDLLVAQK